MKRMIVLGVLAVVAAGCGGTPGYLNTDVLEPAGFSLASATGVKFQGAMFSEGTLTYHGTGDVQKTYIAYVDAMRGLSWAPVASEGDPTKGMTAKLAKDTRILNLEIMPEAQGAVRVTIKVGSGAGPK
jgi:hypothetical protein